MKRALAVLLLVFAHEAFADAGCNSTAPILTAPSDHAEVHSSPVMFRWTAVAGAETYRVWLIEDALDLDVAGETSRTTLTARVAPGTYGWFVEALFGDCAPARSEVFVFEMLRAVHCPALAPVPLSPAEGDRATSPVTFSWTPVPGAIAYEVSAALDGGEPVFVAETSGTALTAHLGEGNVRWMVEAEFSGCAETESVETSFVIPLQPGCDRNAPYLIAPAFGAVDVPQRVEFLWTPVRGARGYQVLLVTDHNEDVRSLGTTTGTRLSANVPAGAVAWSVVAELESCPPSTSPVSPFVVMHPSDCTSPAAPEIAVQPRAIEGDAYAVIWSSESNVAAYEIQESATEDFSSPATRIVNDIRADFSHPAAEADRYFYRVRSLSACGFGASPFSKVAAVAIGGAATLVGQQNAVLQTMRIPGRGKPVSFAVRTDKPWLTASPASGVLPSGGIDVQLIAQPVSLSGGSSQASVDITYDNGRRRVIAHGASSAASIPFSVNLVTPVSPASGSSPLPGSLFIPAIAFGNGWQSDVRIANTSAQVVQYLLRFHDKQTTLQIAPGETVALNDIAKNFYGLDAATDDRMGVLEIRPLTSKAANATFAASRTYGSGSRGTYGQYVPSIPFAKFIGKGGAVLHLQQIASLQRAKLALIEATGEPATALVSLFHNDGKKLLERVVELRAGEHREVGDLPDASGRIDVAVMSGAGKVTAYASLLDVETGDPTFLLPVDASRVRTTRVMLPGIAHIDTGSVSWRSDVRVYNGGTSDTDVALMFIPEGKSDGPAITKRVRAGELLQLDNVLQAHFGIVGSGGAVLVTTPKLASIVASASTFHRAGGGAYSQIIPGTTPADGVGRGERALQVVHVEESDRFRTNLGIVELTGNPVTVEISAHIPDSKLSSQAELTLGANEFRQIGSVLRALGLSNTYNARITLRVVAGEGRVSGHASLIDNGTHDPTCVPAQ